MKDFNLEIRAIIFDFSLSLILTSTIIILLRQVPIKLKRKEINDKSLDSMDEMECCFFKSNKNCEVGERVFG